MFLNSRFDFFSLIYLVISARATSSVNSHIEGHIERGIPNFQHKNNIKKGKLEGVKFPWGASPKKLPLIIKPCSVETPRGASSVG